MFGPGAYRPDPSEGITLPAALPQPEIVPYSRNNIRQPCPRCGHTRPIGASSLIGRGTTWGISTRGVRVI
jgi:hypothetical protein